ncbi:MAG TPA: AAA family ATPase [Bacteroidales bacterium]|nr:AAA family ATPase [Bacteroidales bacterium]
MSPKNTLIINLFGGPAAGKTTCAWEIASKLKKQRLVTEYVSEYAKELVWDEKFDLLDGSEANQRHIFEVQTHRVERLVGKVDAVVTDATLLNSLVYGKEVSSTFREEIIDNFLRFNNFNLFIQRASYFEQEGRVHDLEQSLALDEKIIDILVGNKIPFETYSHRTLDLVVMRICLLIDKNAK